MDVASGMIEVADDDSERWNGKQVSVVAKDGVGKTGFACEAPWLIGKGSVMYLFPWLYRYLL